MTANEKDRFGDKLRDAERAREDQYFAERDRKLLDQLREAKEGEAEQTFKEAALGRCPKCGTRLQSHTLHDISIEECPRCHGMWLDQGELQELGRREDEGWIARWLRLEFPDRK